MADASQAPPAAPLVDLYFRVSVDTEFGEVVGVVGDCPELGNWATDKCFKLKTLESCFPCWFSPAPVPVPLNKRISYKYIVLNSNGEVSRWQGEGDRSLLPTGLSMVVEDDNGLYRKTVPLPMVPGRTAKGSGFPGIADVAQRTQVTTRKEIRELVDGDFMASAIDVHDTLLIVSIELPVCVKRAGEVVQSNSRPSADSSSIDFGEPLADPCPSDFEVVMQKNLFLPLLHNLRKQVALPTKFIGWPGIFPRSDAEQSVITDMLQEYDCIPVFPERKTFQKFVHFCENVILPTFHNVLIINSAAHTLFSAEEWSSYQAINRKWSETIVAAAHGSDLIWIHEYHLLLLPQYVMRKFRRANIGLFLHSPFPSSEIFRSLPMREELLRGMLCADLIGFQFFEYARHFLVACKRLLSLEHHFRLGGFLCIECDGRPVAVKCGHVNIHYEQLRELVEGNPAIKKIADSIKESHRGKYIFASVDRCDRLAGLALKIRAFDNFFENYPNAREKAVFIQNAFPTKRKWDSGCLEDEIQILVREANDRIRESIRQSYESAEHHGNDTEDPPDYSDRIVLTYQEVSQEQKYGLFLAADCFIDTSVRDGLNLNPFEYICVRRGQPSSLVLSEFTGSSRALVSAFRVNPWNVDQTTLAMDRAMKCEELTDGFIADQNYIEYRSTLAWAEDFLRELRRSRKRDDMLYVSWGFANTFRVLGLDSNFKQLDSPAFVYAFRHSRRRVLFFDHEGTLAADRRRITAIPGNDNLFAQGTPPSQLVKECLRSLLQDPRNTVVIMSGRGVELLDSWFGDIKNIGLCAEHGYHLKLPNLTGDEWVKPSNEQDFTWKLIAQELMEQYVRRTQGAFIENKGSALVFQYREADPDFGSWQAKELSAYLQEIMFGHPVTVIQGKGYVEVKLQGVNKGEAVRTVLSIVEKETGEVIDFVACIGDDRADEDMFTAALETFPENVETVQAHTGGGDLAEHTSPLIERSGRSSVSSTGGGSVDFVTKGRLESGDNFSMAACKKSGSRQYGESLPPMEVASTTSAEKLLPHVFTVTVGKKPSSAQFFVNDVDEVSDLLDSLKSMSENDASSPLFVNRKLTSFEFCDPFRVRSSSAAMISDSVTSPGFFTQGGGRQLH